MNGVPVNRPHHREHHDIFDVVCVHCYSAWSRAWNQKKRKWTNQNVSLCFGRDRSVHLIHLFTHHYFNRHYHLSNLYISFSQSSINVSIGRYRLGTCSYNYRTYISYSSDLVFFLRQNPANQRSYTDIIIIIITYYLGISFVLSLT